MNNYEENYAELTMLALLQACNQAILQDEDPIDLLHNVLDDSHCTKEVNNPRLKS